MAISFTKTGLGMLYLTHKARFPVKPGMTTSYSGTYMRFPVAKHNIQDNDA